MNFFEQELRRIVAPLCPDATYVGRACYVRLDEMNRAKLHFSTSGVSGNYDTLQMTILNRGEGKVDVTALRFADLFGKRKVGNPNFNDGIVPHIWEDGLDVQWYVWKPAEQDYAVLRDAVGNYLSVFQEQTQENSLSQQFL